MEIKKIRDMKALLLQRVAGEPVQNLAQAFLSNSVAFIETLLTWMSEQYSELTQEKGEGSEADNWRFICHSVVAIFEALHSRRKYGSHCDPAGQVWYCLQCYGLERELMDQNFSDHKIVTNVLHLHLKNNVVTKTVFEAEVKFLRAELKATKVLAQQANSRGPKKA